MQTCVRRGKGSKTFCNVKKITVNFFRAVRPPFIRLLLCAIVSCVLFLAGLAAVFSAVRPRCGVSRGAVLSGVRSLPGRGAADDPPCGAASDASGRCGAVRTACAACASGAEPRKKGASSCRMVRTRHNLLLLHRGGHLFPYSFLSAHLHLLRFSAQRRPASHAAAA